MIFAYNLIFILLSRYGVKKKISTRSPTTARVYLTFDR